MSEATGGEGHGSAWLESIKLENFMSHRIFEMKFNRYITVVTGLNGSGKSAILAALMVVFGSRSKDTGRGVNVANLIKEGESVAYITATIRLPAGPANGLYAQRYGDRVTIIRRITKSARTTQFKDSEGHSVSIKEPSKELDAIARYCGFFPSNPLVVLTQEAAKQFLTTSSTKDKYKRVQDALRIAGTQKAIESISERIHHQQEKQLENQNIIKHLEAGVVKLQQDLSSAESIGSEIKELQQIVAWRKVKNATDALNTAKRELVDLGSGPTSTTESINDSYEKSLVISSNSINECTERIESLRSRISELSVREQQESAQMSAKQEELDSSLPELNSAMSTLNQWKAELKELTVEASVEHRNAEIASISSKLEELEARKDRKESQIRELEDSLPDMEAVQDGLLAEFQQAKDAKDSSDKLLQEAESELKQLRRENETRRASENNSIIGEIIRNEPAWRAANSKRRPVGPLGEYVQVTDPKWEPILASLLSKTNGAYWVTTSEDAIKLQRHIKQKNLRATVHTRKPEVFDIEAGSLKPEKGRFTRALDLLKFENEQVKCLYSDLDAIEQIALCDSIDEGISLMRAGNRPKNLRTVICTELRNGNRVSRKISIQNQRELSEPFFVQNRASSMRSNLSGQVAQAEEDYRHLAEENKQYARELKDLHNQVRSSQAEIDEIKRDRIPQLHADLNTINQTVRELRDRLETLENTQPMEEFRIDDLRARIEQQERQIAAGNKWQESLQVELRALKEKAAVSKRKHKDAEASLHSARSELSNLHLERDRILQKQDSELRRNATEVQIYQTRHEELSNNVHELDSQLAKCQESASLKGGQLSMADENLNHSIPELEAMVQELVKRKERMERREVDVDELRAKYTNMKRTLDDARNVQAEISEELSILRTALQNRTENLENEWRYLKKQSSKTFSKLMKKMNFQGALDYDDEKGTLSTSVYPASNRVQRTGTLSGGERSFTQLALIVSIWRSMPVNLVAMDEYDVYMDRQTRRRALVLMLDCLREQNQQCVLITPLELDVATLDELGDKISIFRLENPRA